MSTISAPSQSVFKTAQREIEETLELLDAIRQVADAMEKQDGEGLVHGYATITIWGVNRSEKVISACQGMRGAVEEEMPTDLLRAMETLAKHTIALKRLFDAHDEPLN